MPRPKLTQTDTRFSELQSESDSHGETNDCAVKAVSALTDIPYTHVHTHFVNFGRKPLAGTHPAVTAKVLAYLGFKMVLVDPKAFIQRYPGIHKNCKSITTYHMRRFPAAWADGQRYLLCSDHHVSAVVNGVCIDWAARRAKRVFAVYRVESL